MTFKTPLVQYVTYPYYPPALPVRRADDRGGPAYVARATISEELVNPAVNWQASMRYLKIGRAHV